MNNKPLKFRVYIPDFKRFLYFDLNKFESTDLSKFHYEGSHLHRQEYPIQQYTGCHDSSNKEIYEGDIIKYNDGNSIRIGYIGFMAGIFFLNYSDQTDDELGYLLVSNIKVIGNVFENGELLK